MSDPYDEQQFRWASHLTRTAPEYGQIPLEGVPEIGDDVADPVETARVGHPELGIAGRSARELSPAGRVNATLDATIGPLPGSIGASYRTGDAMSAPGIVASTAGRIAGSDPRPLLSYAATIDADGHASTGT